MCNIIVIYNWAGIVLGMGSANERRRYIATSLIGLDHTQNDPCLRLVQYVLKVFNDKCPIKCKKTTCHLDGSKPSHDIRMPTKVNNNNNDNFSHIAESAITVSIIPALEKANTQSWKSPCNQHSCCGKLVYHDIWYILGYMPGRWTLPGSVLLKHCDYHFLSPILSYWWLCWFN